jgi:hypothetical protein
MKRHLAIIIPLAAIGLCAACNRSPTASRLPASHATQDENTGSMGSGSRTDPAPTTPPTPSQS